MRRSSSGANGNDEYRSDGFGNDGGVNDKSWNNARVNDRLRLSDGTQFNHQPSKTGDSVLNDRRKSISMADAHNVRRGANGKMSLPRQDLNGKHPGA